MAIDQTLLASIRGNSFTQRKLSLVNENLTDDDIELLVDALRHNSYVKELDLNANSISNRGAGSLATLSILEVLDVSSNNIGPDGAVVLATSSVQKLNISANPIGDAVASFSSTNSLVELIAAECEITDVGAEQLFLCNSIKKLDLGTNNINGACLRNINLNTVLEDLCLMQNILSPECFDYFTHNRFLIRLDLTNVLLGDVGAAFLAKNRSLRELILIQCAVGDAGAIALSQSDALKKLVLYNNRVKDAGTEALLTNNNLIYLSIKGNSFSTIPIVLRQRFAESSGDVFKRDEAFIADLLKKDFEQRHPSIVREADISTSNPAPFTPQRSVSQTRVPIRPERMTVAVATNPIYVEFFDDATPEQLAIFLSSLQKTIESSVGKKRKLGSDYSLPKGFV